MKESFELKHSISIKKNLNSGIDILKVILTFLILVYHLINQNLLDNKTKKILIEIVPFYFSTSLVIFFYFSYNIFSFRNISQIKLRFLRIIIPYIFWPLIFSVLHIISYDKRIKMNNLLRDLYIQLIIGRRIYFVFWFQFNLIIICFIISIIILTFKKSFLYIFQIMLIFAYIFEYFGISKKILENYNEDIKGSIGRTFKMILFALTGFLLSSIKILNNLKNNKMKSIFLSIFTFVLMICIKIYFSEYYFLEGIFLILGSTSLMIFFAFLPLNKITNMSIIFLIKQSTSYTAGVYYLHIRVQKYFKDSVIMMRDGSLIGCALNYLICYCICFCGMKLFGKTIFKYLFI